MNTDKMKKLHIPYPTGKFSRSNINLVYYKVMIKFKFDFNQTKMHVKLGVLVTGI